MRAKHYGSMHSTCMGLSGTLQLLQQCQMWQHLWHQVQLVHECWWGSTWVIAATLLRAC